MRQDIPRLKPTMHIDAVPELRLRPQVAPVVPKRRRRRIAGVLSALGGLAVVVGFALSPVLHGDHDMTHPEAVVPAEAGASDHGIEAPTDPGGAGTAGALWRSCA